MPASQGFASPATININDQVICQGYITAIAGGSVNLNNGLVLSGSGAVNLAGNLTVNDTSSSMSGNSSLSVGAYYQQSGQEYIGYSGTGTFTQSGGTNTFVGYDSPTALYLGYNPGSSGSYILNGSGQIQSLTFGLGAYQYVGYSGTGSFTQSGGTNAAMASGGLYLGYNSTSRGTYALSGGGQLSAYSEDVGAQDGTGIFTQSGGTNTIVEPLTFADNSDASGTYNLNGGMLIVAGLTQGSGTAAFNFNGGILQASGSFSTSLPMTLGASGGGATFDTAGYAVTLSGRLSGSGGLTKIDNGKLTLSTTNTYSGNTLVSGGMLALGNAYALEKSTLDTNGTGVLSFGSLTAATLGGLTGTGAQSDECLLRGRRAQRRR